MDEEKISKLSIELRRKIYEQLDLFWKANKGLSHHEQFFINSVASSSILAQLTHAMFKKNISHEMPFSYIDKVCEFAKEQYASGKAILDISAHEH